MDLKKVAADVSADVYGNGAGDALTAFKGGRSKHIVNPVFHALRRIVCGFLFGCQSRGRVWPVIYFSNSYRTPVRSLFYS